MEKNKIKKIVQKHYNNIAIKNTSSCCCREKMKNKQIAKSIGYSDKEINSVAKANLGLGCGNPTAIANIEKGDVVLDLGSGAGFDCFLASKRVGACGKVIGVDITQEMINRARENAKKFKYKNVEFRIGDIENLPIEDNSIDVVISNCVINLAPDKSKVFKEVFRVLKKRSGKAYISDIVLLKDLSKDQKNNHKLIAGCVGGAILKNKYLKMVENAGFKVKILSENKDISKSQYHGIALESLQIEAKKMRRS